MGLPLIPETTPVSEPVSNNPEELFLGPAYPNPGSGMFSLQINVPEDMDTSDLHVGVYDLVGRRISRIPVNGDTVIWDGFDANGAPAPAGSYIITPIHGGVPGNGARVVLVR